MCDVLAANANTDIVTTDTLVVKRGRKLKKEIELHTDTSEIETIDAAAKTKVVKPKKIKAIDETKPAKPTKLPKKNKLKKEDDVAVDPIALEELETYPTDPLVGAVVEEIGAEDASFIGRPVVLAAEEEEEAIGGPVVLAEEAEAFIGGSGVLAEEAIGRPGVLAEEEEAEATASQKLPGKKRGRKPKGGKIIQQSVSHIDKKESKPNVILHLKCCMSDLHTNSSANDLESFQFKGHHDLEYDTILASSTSYSGNDDLCSARVEETHGERVGGGGGGGGIADVAADDDSSSDIRELWKKLKILQHNLHVNNISDKKSACFWCTFDFDNPPIHIPKFFMKNSYHVYGCFCTPECAAAYLMDEIIDSSTKFERYHLLNHLYAKIYDYTKNIKPAPNPFYLLDKYYGNLSIQEYRKLLRNERLFLVVDKPLTRILPELHEDNDDFIINNKIIPSNNILVKKKLPKKVKSASCAFAFE